MAIRILESKNILPNKVIKNLRPICFYDESLLCARGDELKILNIKDMTERSICKLPNKWWRRFIEYFQLFQRLFRSGVNYGLLYEGKVYVNHRKKLYEVCPVSNQFKCEFIFEKGKGPLSIAKFKDIEGFNDGLYFGEYFTNQSKSEIKIFHRNSSGEWKCVFKFDRGLINHIHALIPDKKNKCVWILSGDFGNAAAIWRAKNNFNLVEPIVTGSQQFRACVAYPINGGLVYATDSQFEQNYIRVLKNVDEKWTSEEYCKINGSCIYGCQIGEEIVFSTSTEPDNINSRFINKLITTKRGKGIIKNESHIVIGNLAKGFRIISSNKKDFLPYRLFQFGTITFPTGENPDGKLYSYSIGNKKNDLSTEIREII